MASRSVLRDLLERYNERPDERESTLAEIRERFGRRVAILILDTCGFSRAVRTSGIVPFLAAFERLERVIRPSVEEAGGHVLRRDGDDVFAVFEAPAAAVRAAQAILEAVRAANEALPREDEVGVSIGIGYGELLLVGDDDAWGDEMNLASKLGEDLAGRDEVLLTEAAHSALGSTRERFERKAYAVSGFEIAAFLLVTTSKPRPRRGASAA